MTKHCCTIVKVHFLMKGLGKYETDFLNVHLKQTTTTTAQIQRRDRRKKDKKKITATTFHLGQIMVVKFRIRALFIQ